MSLEYIILQKPKANPENKSGEATAESASTTPVLTVERMTPAEAAERAREPGVLVTPEMPMMLIEPLSSGGGNGGAVIGDVTWGVRAVGADRSQFTGEGVVVAVLDTGIDRDHAAFDGVDLEGGRNFVDEQDEKNITDEHGHGTHCAGTIFGRRVDGIRIGVAPGVTRALIGKVIGKSGASSRKVIDAIVWAAQEGAHVISMSLGFDFPNFVERLKADGYPPLVAASAALDGYRANLRLFESVAALTANGLSQFPPLLVAAAGNESRRYAKPPFSIGVSPPAVVNGFVSVAAVRQTDQGCEVAPFSNVGARVAGPGVNVLSAKAGSKTGLIAMDGTSMATPHVAGVAALWAQKLLKADAIGSLLDDKVVGTANTDLLKAGYSAGEVGAGLPQAPLA